MRSPEMQAVFDQLLSQRAERSDDEPTSVEEMRRGFEESFGGMLTTPEGVTVTEVDAGGVPAEWVVPDDAVDARTLVYFHGGGYMIGSPTSHRHLVAHLALASGASALSVDYRLAPEHRFPAAVDDALAAYRWHLASGGEAASTVLVGDSAGGGLVLASLLALRDAGDPLPAGAVVMSPWADLTNSGESYTARGHRDPMIQTGDLAHPAGLYLGDDADPKDPLASPIFGVFDGLPPLLVQVGTEEVLHDDALRVAEAAEAAGVDVVFEAWDDMCHVFQLFVGVAPEASRAIDRSARWIVEQTAP